jgi:hypothetical protein
MTFPCACITQCWRFRTIERRGVPGCENNMCTQMADIQFFNGNTQVTARRAFQTNGGTLRNMVICGSSSVSYPTIHHFV